MVESATYDIHIEWILINRSGLMLVLVLAENFRTTLHEQRDRFLGSLRHGATQSVCCRNVR